MRLATVLDPDSNEPRPVFELPSGRRVELRELFQPISTELDEDALHEPPLYFTDVGKTVEFLDDVIDAVRQWSRERALAVERRGGSELDAQADAPTRVDRMAFLPPVPIVRSFREFDTFEAHAKAWRDAHKLPLPESWRAAPTFSFANAGTLIGHNTAVSAPDGSRELDFGLQIGAIVGRGGKNILERDAWKHVAGFTIVNAFAARDLERVEVCNCLGRGKSRDFATAVGPYLVSLGSLADKIDAEGRIHLTMRASVNGKEFSRGDAASMTFGWPSLIEQASRDAELFPGDLISAGTIGNGSVLSKRPDGAAYLKAGDVIELEVERLGILRTPIVERKDGSRESHARREVVGV